MRPRDDERMQSHGAMMRGDAHIILRIVIPLEDGRIIERTLSLYVEN